MKPSTGSFVLMVLTVIGLTTIASPLYSQTDQSPHDNEVVYDFDAYVEEEQEEKREERVNRYTSAFVNLVKLMIYPPALVSHYDGRGGFEVGNCKIIENITALYSFVVKRSWGKAEFKSSFTSIYANNGSDAGVDIDVEPEDYSFKSAIEYVDYMLQQKDVLGRPIWASVYTAGTGGVRRNIQDENGQLITAIARLYKEPGHSIVVHLTPDEQGHVGEHELNRVLNTVDLIKID